MGYISRKGRRPMEYASKSSHSNIINDKTVEEFIQKCSLPKTSEDVDIGDEVDLLKTPDINPIKSIIAIDGGYTEAVVRKKFPSATITFFQFGALFFSIADLEELERMPFIEPKDISKLKKIQRLKLVLPTKNVSLKDESSFVKSVRRTIFNYFISKPEEDHFIDTLKWFIFEEYDNPKSTWKLASCPTCGTTNISINRMELKNYITICPTCKSQIFLTDVFRLHEAIDNELGAGGILGYVTTLIEQVLLTHVIRLILKTKPSLLNEILFVKDGPLAFFGQTANMYKPMRRLMTYLIDKHKIHLAGMEKSGAFVEHADEISSKLDAGQILILDNDYIYKYVIPGKADPSNPYGRTTYYGNKIIFKSQDERIYVITLPTTEVLAEPKREDFKNIDTILYNIQKLKCDMYDSSLIPIALVNKLVSLSNHPSSVILEKFAKQSMG